MKQPTRLNKRLECKICHKKTYNLSRSGLCSDCSTEKVELARSQIRCKQGEIYEKWKSNIIKSLDKSL